MKRPVIIQPLFIAALSILAFSCSDTLGQMSPLRYPPLRGGQIRIEGYLVPAVTSWPAYPSWAPRGDRIAFSMDGQIWTVPSDGGKARQVTSSPGYDFEPDWSPNGEWLAFSRDRDGNLDIFAIEIATGREQQLTRDPHLEFHPRWISDGEVTFSSAASGSFDIHKVDLHGSNPTPLVSWPRNDIQPDPSPVDPGTLVLVSARSGRIGTGGIWITNGDEAKEIHFEETTYRTRPSWSPDGKWIAFVSDSAGTNDIWLIAAEGGIPFRLTRDGTAHEFAPSWSPDGKSIAYATTAAGRRGLEKISVHGGSTEPIRIESLERSGEYGPLMVHLSHPSRVTVLGSDGRFHAPRGSFRRVTSFNEVHYFYSAGSFDLEVPIGPTEIRVSHGPEFFNVRRSVEVESGSSQSVSVNLSRLANWDGQGWISGDTHVHDLHAGDLRLAPEELVEQAEAEDVRVVNSLIHVDGSKLMGDLSRFVAGAHPASTERVLLRYGQEYRMPFGHRTFLNLQKMFFPLVSGLRGTVFEAPYPPLFTYLREIRRQQPDVLVGIPHPYFGYLANRILPVPGTRSEIPADVALGLVDHFDINCIWSDEAGSSRIYASLLNSGFRLAASGGSDTFSDLWRDPPMGTGRTYVKVEGDFSLDSWYSALKSRRSFATNGPLLELEVQGRSMGEEFRLSGPGAVQVEARALSNVKMDSFTILVNGQAKQVVTGDRQTRIDSPAFSEAGWELRWSGTLEVSESSWIAVKAEGGPSDWTTDSSLFAHSTPVWVIVGGREVLVEEDLEYLTKYMESLVEYARNLDSWDDEEQKRVCVEGFEEAGRIYKARLREATSR